MTAKNTTRAHLKGLVLSVARDDKPETVDQLVRSVQQKHPASEREITNLIIELQNEGKLRFTQKETAQLTLRVYVLSSAAAWFWVTVTLALATTLAVFTVPEGAYPTVYVRYALGAVFVLWLPGYALIKALYPSKQLDTTERTALSIGLSLALDAIAGLLLNYTPWGIGPTPITLSLLVLTAVFTTAALVREHESKPKS